jgi:transcriptional regulator with XRE-family HTH domain
MSEMRTRLLERFHDPEYRRVYWHDFLNTAIATQIKVLRESRGLTQAQLAALVGTSQPAISAHESPDKKSWSIATLRKLADAFDVALVVKFESFGRALDEIVNFSKEHLAAPPFDEDPAFNGEGELAGRTIWGTGVVVVVDSPAQMRRVDTLTSPSWEKQSWGGTTVSAQHHQAEDLFYMSAKAPLASVNSTL